MDAMSRAKSSAVYDRLAPGHHLYRGSDGVWRCSLPGDRFLRLGGPDAVLRGAQHLLHGATQQGAAPTESTPVEPVAVDLAFLDGLAQRGLLATAPAKVSTVGATVAVEGEGPIAAMVADLLAPAVTVVRVTPLSLSLLAGLDVAVSCAGWLPDTHWRHLDRWCHIAGVAWHRCHAEGDALHLGPFLIPNRTPGYADARARRLAAAQLPAELRDLWSYLDAGGPMPPVPWPDRGGVAVAAGLLVSDVLAYVSGRPVPSASDALEMDRTTLRVTRHPVLPVPRGRDGRWLRPVGSVPVVALVDPRVGLVRRLARNPAISGVPRAFVDVTAEVAATGEFTDWVAGAVTGGAALGDPERARAAALGEAIEHYCGNAVPEDMPVSSAEALASAGYRVLDLGELALYSTAQYAEPGFPFTRLTADLEISWVPGTDLDTGEQVWVPAALAHLNMHRTRPNEPAIICQAYAGLAAGDGTARAERSALEELIERDAVTIWWASAAAAQRLAVDDDPALAPVLADTRAAGLEVTFLRIPCVFDVPVVGAFVADHERGVIGFGSACRPTGAAAAEKALTEAIVTCINARQLADPDSAFWSVVRAGRLSRGPYTPWRAERDYRAAFRPDYRDMAVLEVNLQLYLDPAMQTEPLRRLREPAGCIPLHELGSLAGDPRSGYLARLRAHRRTAISIDLTTTDVAATGMRVARVVVPAMYHNAPAAFPLLGGTRLYTEPVARGWVRHPFTEYDVVRHPLPFA
jgi:ribosomal protein S12 methylthiotransferase accessory factor